jgi:hypothetical protein
LFVSMEYHRSVPNTAPMGWKPNGIKPQVRATARVTQASAKQGLLSEWWLL